MKSAIMLVLAAGLSSAAYAQGLSASSVSWLTGCWSMQNRGSLIEEQWMAPRGGMMLGMGRTTRRDSTLSFEFTRIYRRGDTLVFAANTSDGQTEFKARTAGDSVVFENPEHDFPQRVIYRKARQDSLVARIEGMRGGQLRGMTFSYRRVACGQ